MRQKGFTLVELMIAILLGLIVVGATITIYIATLRSSTDTVRSARLNYDLDAAMALMVNDIRRAGYWGGAVIGSDARDNPANLAANTLQIPNASCVLYSYDANGNGQISDDERYGFRLTNGALQMRLSGTTTADCNDGVWQALTLNSGGEQVEITTLTFSFVPIVTPPVPGQTKCLNRTANLSFNSTCADAGLASNVNAVEIRQVNIVLAARVAADTAVTKTITNTVKVRNDRIFTQP